MGLREQINEDLKTAMRAKEVVRRDVLRGVLNAFKEAEQSNREDLVKRALKKHELTRPNPNDEVAVAAYDEQFARVMAEEKVEENAVLGEDDLAGVIQKLVKMRKDSIDEAEKANRSDIADSEKEELAVLEEYMPKQMSRDEIVAIVKAQIEKSGAEGPKDMGKVMGPVMGQLKGKADGKVVNEVVRELLS